MVTYQYAPFVDGGAERQAQQLAERLAERGRRVGVVTVRYRGLAPEERLNGVEVHRVWAVPKRGRLSVTFLPSLAKFLMSRGQGFDIWHIHQAYYTAWLAIHLARPFGKVCVVKAAASGPYGDIARLRNARFGNRVVRALRHATACVSLNEELTKELVAAGVDLRRIRVIANSVDNDRFAPPTLTERSRARESLGAIPEGTPVVVYVGRLAHEKGVGVLLDAWETVDKRSASASPTLILAGDGPNAAEYRARAETRLRKVRFLGKVSDVRQVLRAADALVLPSLSEGLSNAVLEAMATGLPVVATRIGGLREQVEDGVTGLLVEPANARALGDAIIAILGDAARRARMGEIARRVAVERFGVEPMVQSYERLYDELSLTIAG